LTLRDCADKEIVPWDVLCGDGTTILKSIGRKWHSIIDHPGVRESDIHEFLSEHSSLFFGQDAFVISRAELGSDFQVDFVIARDQASYGIGYTFVEIETPQSLVYTRSGDPSARLTHAIQQVLNWKTWLTRHRVHVRRFFPSKYWGWEEFTNLSFCIVIGRRGSQASVTAKRNVLARETGISIRSFDHFTDMFRLTSSFIPTLAPHDATGKTRDIALNQLANPFARAYSWRAWRKVVEQRHFDYCHFVAQSAESLLAHRTYSRECEAFLTWWRSLSARRRAACLSRRVDVATVIKSMAQFDGSRN
jgi:hypothetical protein